MSPRRCVQISALGALVFLGLGKPDTAVAQSRMQAQFIPFVAAYYSARQLGDVANPSLQGVQALQNNAIAFGGGLSVMFSDVAGVEASVAYALSDARIQACTPADVCAYADLNGTLILGSVAAKLRPRRSNFFAALGLGVTTRGGDIWQDLQGSEKLSLGGMLGIGVLSQVAPKFGLDVRVEAYVYSFDPDGSFTDFDSALATDFLIKIGIPIPSR